MAKLVGQTLKGRYHVQELIGRGGMAEVYLAWDLRRQYHVALKVMREDLAEDVEFLRRFRREARALAALSHANIVRFYSFEREGRMAFIVMDYVDGTTLRGRILDADEQPLPVSEVASVMQQTCAALHYAHGENVLHRDVKPGNIMIDRHGRVLVADFGIAKAADAATATTVMPGTPAYMSPEQCRSEPVDERTDVYSLGIVAYEMLTGRRPFVGDTEATTGSTREKLRWEQIHAPPPSLRALNPAVSPQLDHVVRTALAKDREDRWPTALSFGQAFARALPRRGATVPEGKPGAGPTVAQAGVGAARPRKARATAVAPRVPRAGLAAPTVARRIHWGWILTSALAVILVLAILLIAFNQGRLVPSVVGQRLDLAGAVLQEAGLEMHADYDGQQPADRYLVAGQDPDPGERLRRGRAVAVSVITVTPEATATEPAPTAAPEPTPQPTRTLGPTASPTTVDPTNIPTVMPPTLAPTDTPWPTDTPRPTDTPSPEPSKTSTSPPPSARFGRLAFTSNRAGNPEIYVLNLANGTLSRLTNNTANDWLPDWSPDGRLIAFTSNRSGGNYDLWQMDSSGGGAQTLVAEQAWDEYAHWSPDGNRLALSTTAVTAGQPNSEIFIRRADGSLKQVTQSVAEDQYPDWSPDGGRIVYTEGQKGSANWDIYIIDTGGSNRSPWLEGGECDVQPSWSPDGHQIAFLRITRDNDGSGKADQEDAGEIWVGNASGGGLRRLTSGSCDLTPAWSPDSRWIAFARLRDSNGNGRCDGEDNADILAVPVGGGSAVELVTGPHRDGDPSWTR